MIDDDALTQAAAQAAALLNDSLPQPEDCCHEFSPHFRRQMQQLLFRQNHPTLFRCLKSAAIILLTLTVLFASLLAVSTEAREFVFGWVRNKFASGFFYAFDGESFTDEIPQYYLSWIPDGYTQDFTSELEGGKILGYVNAAGQQMLFAYSSASTGTIFALLQCEDYKQEEVSINGIAGTLYIPPSDEESSTIVWINHQENIIFDVDASVDKQTLIKIAENVMEKLK